jgi:thiol:disulfide interchange protein
VRKGCDAAAWRSAAEQAFAIGAQATSRERIEFRWQVAEGYYLYLCLYVAFTSTATGQRAAAVTRPDARGATHAAAAQ